MAYDFAYKNIICFPLLGASIYTCHAFIWHVLALKANSTIFKVILVMLEDYIKNNMSKEQLGYYSAQLDDGELVVQPLVENYARTNHSQNRLQFF